MQHRGRARDRPCISHRLAARRLRLSWPHVGKHAIVVTTGKSKHRRAAIIPLYDDLKNVLTVVPKRSTTILTNSKARPWTKDGFGSSFNKAKTAAGMSDANLHFHDLRFGNSTKENIACKTDSKTVCAKAA